MARGRAREVRTTPFLPVASHHPLYSNGQHRGDPRIYSFPELSGQDHDLEHLQFKGHATSFVISGGAGAELVGWTTPPLQKRGPWGLHELGFTDLQISKDDLAVRHIGKSATIRYEFKNRSTHKTLVIRAADRLLLLSDHDAYAGPTIMPQSRWGSRAQGHNADILCGEWVPCLEVISNELRACIGPGKSSGRRCGV